MPRNKKNLKKIEKIYESNSQDVKEFPSKKIEKSYGKSGYRGETLGEN